MPVFIDQCSLVCAHLVHLLVAWRVASYEDSTSQYIPYVGSCDSNFKYWHLGTVFSSVSIVDIHGRSKVCGCSSFGQTSFHSHFGNAHSHVACVHVATCATQWNVDLIVFLCLCACVCSCYVLYFLYCSPLGVIRWWLINWLIDW